MVEKGHRPEENQVSSTSGSRANSTQAPNRSVALALASASVAATTKGVWSVISPPVSLMAYQAGIWCPHQSWREMHQSFKFTSQSR